MATANLVTPNQAHVTLLTGTEENGWLVPQDWRPLRNYAFRLVKELETGRGVHWLGLIYCDGVPVLEVENRGDGGCNWYYEPNSGLVAYGEAIQVFRAMSKLAYPSDAEAEDTAVAFLDSVNEIGPQE